MYGEDERNMKIKTQVNISLIVFAILAIVIVLSFFSSNDQLHEIQKKQQIIDGIEKTSFELYYLENDYILHGGTRTVERWNAKYAALTGQLLELTVTDPSQQAVLDGMFDSHRNLNTSFSNLVAVTGGVQGKEPIGTSQELKEFSASTLAGQTQALMADSSELSQLVKAESREVEQRTTLVFLFSIAGLMVFVLLNYLVINRSVLMSISALQNGAKRIGTGDLDTKIETGSSDELGDLSSAVTAMASSLKTVLASKSELEKEVAERKRAQEQLKESETRYREFFTTSRDCVFITSPDGRIIDFNDATLEMFGYDNREEMSDVSIPSLYAHSEDRSAFLNLIVRDGYVKEFPVQLKRRDGTVIDALINGVPLRNPDGTIKALIGTARDITERKRAQTALQESENRYRTLAESTPDSIIILTREGRFMYINNQGAATLGKTVEDARGLSISDVFPLPAVVHMMELINRMFTIGLPIREEILVPSPAGLKSHDAFLIPLKTPDGTVTSILVISRDISERKRTEEEIQLLNATLEQRVRDRTQELEQATEAIRASLDEKVILLREVHHRVKNNLQIIISLSNLQMRQIDDKQLKQVMVDTQNRVRAMSFVHEKLYRSEDLSHIDLSDYIRYLATHLFASYNVNSQQVSLNLDIKKIMLNINTAIPLGLIINELISNSLKYAFPDGRKGEIFIALQREDHTLTLLFKDNGIGIPADLDWRDTKSLGLRLVVSLVEQLDGTIELDRTAGTAFTIVVKENE